MRTSHAPKLFRKLILLVTILALLAPVYPARAERTTSTLEDSCPLGKYQYIRDGIDCQKFHLTSPDPVDIFVARMHRGEVSVTIESGIAQGKLSGGVETTSAMAARYDNAINYWGQIWGNRNDVAVAVNGFYFGEPLEPQGVPWSGVIQSGWYAKRFWDGTGDVGFAWTLDRQAFIGACVIHIGNKNEVSFERSDYTPNIDAINISRESEQFIIYTPQFDSNTGTDSSALELMIELTAPSQVYPKGSSGNNGIEGFIRKITKNSGSSPLYADYVVLSFWGDKLLAMQQRIDSGVISVGDKVWIAQEITDCIDSKTGVHDWTKTYASLGGDYHFLINGVYYPQDGEANVPNSRTVVAYSSEYIYFIVVDGFNPGISEGISIGNLSSFIKSQLNATDAVSLDSGTSSTMIIDGQVINNVYCTCTRLCDSDSTNDTISNVSPVENLSPEAPYSCDPNTNEAYAGTSLMLVSVQPIAQSTTFTNTQSITTKTSVSVRLGPGTNYASLGTAPSGATGEVIANLSKLNGVMAKNTDSTIGYSFWWFVDVGDLAGWVPEESIRSLIPPTPVTFTDFAYLPTIPRALMSAVAAAYSTPTPPTR